MCSDNSFEPMTPIEEIERDLVWREAELASLRVMLANEGLTKGQKLALFRASWALLYAHYEGFCKFALTIYFNALEASGAKCSEFNPKTQAFALTKELKEIRNLPAAEFLSAVRGFEDDILDKPITFPEVDTESNLRPRTLIRLLENADLEIESLLAHNHALDTLVNRRNKISHGERDIISEFDYYIGYESAVQDIMIGLALAIDQKILGT